MIVAVLSDQPLRMSPMSRVPWHPWRALREHPEITQVFEEEPGRLGSWCQVSRHVRLHPELTQAERRCTLTHELIHAERGDTSCDPSVHREAARRLIATRDLLAAVAFYGEDWPAVAEELWVDEDTLQVRLDTAHPAEKGALRRTLALREESA